MVLAQIGVGRRSLLVAGVISIALFFFFYSSPPKLSSYLAPPGPYDNLPTPRPWHPSKSEAELKDAPDPPPYTNMPWTKPPQSDDDAPKPEQKQNKEEDKEQGKPKEKQPPSRPQKSQAPAAKKPEQPDGSSNDKPLHRPPKFLVVVGDSYSWTNFSLEKTWPDKKNPMGNPAFPGVTSAHGANWVGWLAGKYNSSFLYTFNLAVAGATTDNSLVDAGSFRDFKEQITHDFIPYIVQDAKRISWTPEETVFGVAIGINDIARTWGHPVDVYEKLVPQIMDSYWDSMDRIYKTGVRKIFLFDIPPQQYTPGVLGNPNKSHFPQWTKYGKFYNDHLYKGLEDFKKSHPDALITAFDHDACYRRVLADPGKYGFVNNDTIGDVKDHIWADLFHPGTRMHEIVASDLADHLHSVGIQI